MIGYRCRCGKHTAYGSMPPMDCQGCPECGVTLAAHPDGHRPLAPHDFQDRFDPRTGEKVARQCAVCGEREVRPPETRSETT